MMPWNWRSRPRCDQESDEAPDRFATGATGVRPTPDTHVSRFHWYRLANSGDGVDGPRRHRLCQNEVVADLRQRRPSVEQISRIGMDTSKHFFQLRGVNAAEKVVCARSCGARRWWLLQGACADGDRDRSLRRVPSLG